MRIINEASKKRKVTQLWGVFDHGGDEGGLFASSCSLKKHF